MKLHSLILYDLGYVHFIKKIISQCIFFVFNIQTINILVRDENTILQKLNNVFLPRFIDIEFFRNTLFDSENYLFEKIDNESLKNDEKC